MFRVRQNEYHGQLLDQHRKPYRRVCRIPTSSLGVPHPRFGRPPRHPIFPPTNATPSRRTNARPSFPSWHGELMQKLNDRRERLKTSKNKKDDYINLTLHVFFTTQTSFPYASRCPNTSPLSIYKFLSLFSCRRHAPMNLLPDRSRRVHTCNLRTRPDIAFFRLAFRFSTLCRTGNSENTACNVCSVPECAGNRT